MFEKFLILARTACHLDQKTVATAAGIAVSRYKAIEAGKTVPTDEERKILARLFNFTPEDIENGFKSLEKFSFMLPAAEVFFGSKELSECVYLRMTELYSKEKLVVWLLRRIGDEKLIDDIIKYLMERE